jgi:phosphoribosylformylglycinamidine (FGAM) synthase-like amidotransferase family enzyme
VSARVAVVVFPGTNSEDETLRALQAVGLDAELVHWSAARELAALRRVTCCRAALRTRIAFGPAPSRRTTRLMRIRSIDAAEAGKFVLGICNGAQILAEAGLVPGNRSRATSDCRLRAERKRPIPVGARLREAGGRAGTRPDPGRH